MKHFLPRSFICLLVLFASCDRQSKEDKLAVRLSQSKNFIALEQNSLKMSDAIIKAKKDPVLTNKFKTLDSVSRRDSILKYLFHSDAFTNNSIAMGNAAKAVSQEFPELKELSKETKTKVWRKAASIILANQPIK